MSTEGTETPSLHDVLTSQHEVIVINRRKRNAKRNMSKVRYELEKLTANTPANEGEVRNLEHCMEELWQALEETQTVLDDLAALYIDNGDKENQKIISEESQKIERECNLAIEKAQRMIVAAADNERNDKSSTETETTDNKKNNLSTGPNSSFQSTSTPIKPSTSKASPINAKLQPLAVPSFNGSKAEFEEYWALFESLVDCSEEPTNIKMARLKQSLTGSALEAVRGLGVSQPEYEEAKEILKTKFGGQRRQLQAYLDELEKIPPLKTTDLKGFERFADLVRVTVVKLQADGRDGELGEGTLHSMLAKKLTDRQVECYTRWISENHKERSVISLRDWLKEEVAIKVEAAEMSHGLAVRAVDTSTAPKPRSDRFKSRSFFASSGSHQSKSTNAQNQKPPCAFCSGLNHGIWNCHSFKQKSVEERWSIAKEKKLCFRCLSSDHMGKDCKRSHPCNVNRCQLSHHQLLHRVVASPTVLTSPQNTSGFSSTHFTQASPVWSASNPVPCNPQSSPVQYSSPSVPVQYSSPSVPAQFSPPAPPKGADQALPREGVRTNHAVNMSTHSPEMAQCALRTVPVWLKGNGRKVKVNAILDDGSNETFLNQEVANYLGLQAPFQSVQVHVLNNAVETFQSMPLRIEIESVSGDFHKEIEVQTCPQQVTGLYKVEDWNDTKQQWPHLKNCQFPKPAREGIVDLLIGVDNAELHYSMADIQGKNGGPIARLGPLGWTCIGTTSGRASEGKRSHLVHSFLVRESERTNCVQQEHEVNNLLRRFWEVDSYGTETPRTSVMTKEEKNAYETVKSSLQHTGNRYRITVPWKDNKDVLPNNKEAALKRLEMTEKSLAKKDFVKSEYANTLKAYVEKGYLRKLAPEEKQSINSWYLPHFPIVRMDKTTTKVRIVFDCSAKHLGVSLNDVIHAGPKLQSELFDVLVRFRRNPIGIVCDIKEMYLQVEIEEKDRPFFRLLWRDLEIDREPDEYEFTRVVFGKNSAPMESQLVSQENARQHQDRYPLAAETVLKSTYMDDSIDSVEDEATALKLYGELQELWGIAGMQARKWVSNSEEVLSAIPEDHRASEILINDDRPVTKTLGVAWSSKEDTLKISVPAVSPELQITKRNVLRRIASVFDPLGLISPIVIGGKALLQTLWSRGYGWDDEIEDETAVKITKWLQQLEAVSEIKVPRCVRMADTVSSFKLIMFADASEIAYGAAVYARVEYKHSDVVTCRLIASKVELHH